MASITSAIVIADNVDAASVGRVAFLMARPDVTAVYSEYRQPGTIYAYYNPSNGFAELYVVDTSGYKFMALG